MYAKKGTAHFLWYTAENVCDNRASVCFSIRIELRKQLFVVLGLYHYINPFWVIAVQICLHIWQVKLSNGSCKLLFGQMKKKLSPCQFQSLFNKTFLTKGESQVLPFLLLMQFPKKVPLPFLR